GNPETVTDETGHWPWDNVVAAVTNVVQAVAPAVANIVQQAAPVVASVANAALGISDMVNDVKTLFNPNASWQDKFGSVVNLGFNVFMDATTVMGVGEGLKGLEIVGKFAADEGMHAVGEGAEKDLAEQGEKEAAENASDACSLNSFAYATVVATPHGKQQIGSLKVGSTVLAYDGATGKVKSEQVQQVFIHHDDNLLDVTLSTTTTTPVAQDQDHSASKQREAEVAAHGAHAPPATETMHTTTEHPFLTSEL